MFIRKLKELSVILVLGARLSDNIFIFIMVRKITNLISWKTIYAHFIKLKNCKLENIESLQKLTSQNSHNLYLIKLFMYLCRKIIR